MSSFIQWNINGFYKRSVDISCIIYNLQPAILCFQETNLKNNHCATIKNYKGYFKNRTHALRASGGVANFIKDTIDSENIPIISEHEVIATLVKFHKPLKLLTALQSCNNKSPGPDNVPYIFIKNLPPLGFEILLQIYNTIWTQGLFPNQWRNANIIPIPKPDKSKFDIENYRPI
ncbi:hypothetical protein QTP88_006358 [Uroleucon formosanum]